MLLVKPPVNRRLFVVRFWGSKKFSTARRLGGGGGVAESHCSTVNCAAVHKEKVKGPVLANHVFKLNVKTYLEKAAVPK